MRLTVHLIHAPPGWTAPLTFERELDVLVLLRKLGPAFLARHGALHAELIPGGCELVG